MLGTFTILGLILGLSYGFVGFVDLPVTTLTSGLALFGADDATFGPAAAACLEKNALARGSVLNAGYACDAGSGGVPTETWSVRTSFPVYVVALTSVVSWVSFIAFGGVGISAVPVDLVKRFLGRPKTVIAKSEYIKIAGKLAQATQVVVAEAREVQREERGTGRTRKTRRALAKARVSHPPQTAFLIARTKLTLPFMYRARLTCDSRNWRTTSSRYRKYFPKARTAKRAGR